MLNSVERLLIFEEDGPALISNFALEDLDSEDDGSWSESEKIHVLGDPLLRARRLDAGKLVSLLHILAGIFQKNGDFLLGKNVTKDRVLTDCAFLLPRQGLSCTARRKLLSVLRNEVEP